MYANPYGVYRSLDSSLAQHLGLFRFNSVGWLTTIQVFLTKMKEKWRQIWKIMDLQDWFTLVDI